ncbi:MAG: 1-acyl-sn-glycerol-3-phosphate acyltransferase [Pseudomonadales bacterium]|nr:1-acyl-sn-glycerol-3-phosphate acyltransferase [Pseudomonadales bacterium]
MSSFDAIRHYTDAEVPGVLTRLMDDPGFIGAMATIRYPRLYPLLRPFIAWGVRRRLKELLKDIRTVADVQLEVGRLLASVERKWTEGVTLGGLENLPDAPCLFIANHRDIVLDSAFLNWQLHLAGRATCLSAVGDNLVTTPWVGDLMRLNKSFVVPRSVTSPKAAFKAFSETSAFIRSAMDGGQSVWIAQRQGRAKDGNDRTDAAVLKMLTIAWRQEISGFHDYLDRVHVLPVSISYELDPCDLMKAHELAMRDRDGAYTKASDEDLRSIALGILGYKGRVHLQLGQRLTGAFTDADAAAQALDVAIAAGTRVYPTHRLAAEKCGDSPGSVPDEQQPAIQRVMDAFAAREQAAPASELSYLYLQYANVWRNAATAQTMSGGSSSAASCSRNSSTWADQ